MRRSFPLIMKYPPNSSGSSWRLTSSAEDRERRLQRTDCTLILERELENVERNTYANHDWYQTTVLGNKSHCLIWFVNLPAKFYGHTSAVGCQSFSGLGDVFSSRANCKSRMVCEEYAHLRRKNLALYSASISVGNHRSRDGDLVDPNLNFSVGMNS
jgi:hypothetical protein